jgi:hypothetical protein
MAQAGMAEIGVLLRNQHEAIVELIDIALTAARESGDSSVGAIHVITRLNKLADAVQRSAVGIAQVAPPRASLQR